MVISKKNWRVGKRGADRLDVFIILSAIAVWAAFMTLMLLYNKDSEEAKRAERYASGTQELYFIRPEEKAVSANPWEPEEPEAEDLEAEVAGSGGFASQYSYISIQSTGDRL